MYKRSDTARFRSSCFSLRHSHGPSLPLDLVQASLAIFVHPSKYPRRCDFAVSKSWRSDPN